MRYTLAFLLLAFCFSASYAQPPTKVERESQEDIYEDSKVSTASARGSAVSQRPYAETPSMQEDLRQSEEIAGTPPPRVYRYTAILDSEQEFYADDPSAFDDYDRPLRTRVLTEDGVETAELRYTYGENGELSRIDRYRPGTDVPFATYGYRYTRDMTVIEEQLMPDGTQRFVREVGLDEFQAAQGPGNQPYRDNRPDNQYNSVPNEPASTPMSPRNGDGG